MAVLVGVAWGAVIKKDQLVGDFLRVCDLSAETLKDPNANVHKVVAYLEARLPDDQTVVGRNVPGTSVSWAPAKIELTTASWISARIIACRVRPITTQMGSTSGSLTAAPFAFVRHGISL